MWWARGGVGRPGRGGPLDSCFRAEDNGVLDWRMLPSALHCLVFAWMPACAGTTVAWARPQAVST